MAKKLNSVLGIDIGSQSIKIAEIKMSGREPSITALGMAATPDGAVDHTGVYEPDAIGAVLKDLLASAGASVGQAVVSIAGQASVLVRTVEVPRMAPKELDEHMQWEISRNLPFAETTVESDYKTYPSEDPNSANVDVVMAISPRSAIDTLISTLRKAGKTPAAIDVEPLAMVRSLAHCYSDVVPNKTVCMVEVGHKTTSINMYRNNQLLLPRQVPIGGENFTRSIADGLGISVEDAEHMKQSRAVIPDSAAAAILNPFGNMPAVGGYGYSAPTTDYATQGYAAPATDDVTGGYSASPFGDDAPVADSGETVAMPAMPEAVSQGDPEMMRIYQSFQPMLEEFLSEVRRSVDYFRSKGGEVDVIYLAGGGAKLRGLAEFLHATLGISVELLDPLRGMPIGGKRIENDLLQNNRPDFTVAIGNSLHICYE